LTELRISHPKTKKAKLQAAQLRQSELLPFIEDGEVGPGSYDPLVSLIKKKPPSCGWSHYKTQRQKTLNSQVLLNPGPEKYNQQQNSIGMRMMKNIIKQENALDDQNRQTANFNRLV
jgi:hypothetical protein